MNPFARIKQYILFFGDIIILYAALAITLWFRYGDLAYNQFFGYHLQPFTFIFIIWVIIFYIAGLYDLKSLKNDLEFQKSFWYSMGFNIVLAALFFYLIPYFSITPKTNLILLFIVFVIVSYIWRRIFNLFAGETSASTKILMVGSNQTVEEIIKHLEKNPQLGYQIKFWMKEGLKDHEFEHLSQIVVANEINTIVVPAHLKKDNQSAKLIYQTLVLGVEVIDLATLYELIYKKVPLAELEEVWFLENLVKKHKIYGAIKEPVERMLFLILSIALLPLFIFIGILVKLTSKGPAIFKQKRVGKSEEEFTIYKFRTMRQDAEKNGPQWANYFNDERATPIGKILRRTHLDELPQLFNIVKGDLSFIGPRPERPEFVNELKNKVPYYELRLLNKPGITGWAQINFRYGASVEETYEKLQYDIYYIKNNSPFLDAQIILKTLKFLITNNS
ncbi:MAG: sugar transferase [Candidatus Pacebacteria bacterium]|nr:sugar transferase [Candidatus Paceibacterota bacterium]